MSDWLFVAVSRWGSIQWDRMDQSS